MSHECISVVSLQKVSHSLFSFPWSKVNILFWSRQHTESFYESLISFHSLSTLLSRPNQAIKLAMNISVISLQKTAQLVQSPMKYREQTVLVACVHGIIAAFLCSCSSSNPHHKIRHECISVISLQKNRTVCLLLHIVIWKGSVIKI